MVYGNGTRADGARSSQIHVFGEIVGSRDGRAAKSTGNPPAPAAEVAAPPTTEPQTEAEAPIVEAPVATEAPAATEPAAAEPAAAAPRIETDDDLLAELAAYKE